MNPAGPVLLALLALAPAQAGSLPEAYLPASPDTVLLVLPEGGAEQALQRRARALAPDDWPARLELVRAYRSLGRRRADPRLDGQAEALLQAGRVPAPFEALLLEAELRQVRHDFAGALSLLARAEPARPREPQLALLRAQILRVQGRFGEARQACLALLGRVGELLSTTCLAETQSLSGQLAASRKLLESVYARAGAEPPAQRAWTAAVLAEMAERAGEAGAAEQHYRESLTLAPEQHAVRAALADRYLAQGRDAEVRELLRDTAGIDALVLRQVLALSRLGAPEAGPARSALDQRLAAQAARGEPGHEREQAWYALYLAHDTRAALSLAQANWRRQREPVDNRLLLAAARAAGDGAALAELEAWRESQRLEDAGLDAVRSSP